MIYCHRIVHTSGTLNQASYNSCICQIHIILFRLCQKSQTAIVMTVNGEETAQYNQNFSDTAQSPL